MYDHVSEFLKKVLSFLKNLYKYHFWLGGLLEEKMFLPSPVSYQRRGIFNGSFMQNFNQIGQLFQKLCHFFNFFLVGWLVCLDSSAFFKTHQNIGDEPS